MATDQTHLLALQQAALISAQIEVSLQSKKGTEPLLVVLNKAKEDAAAALIDLVDVDPTDTNTIRRLQNEVTRFRDLTSWLQQLLIDGIEAGHELDEIQMEEARGLVIDDDTAEGLGISNQGEHNDD